MTTVMIIGDVGGCAPELARAARRTVTRIGTERFIAVDPEHGRTGAPEWAPLILRNAELIA